MAGAVQIGQLRGYRLNSTQKGFLGMVLHENPPICIIQPKNMFHRLSIIAHE